MRTAITRTWATTIHAVSGLPVGVITGSVIQATGLVSGMLALTITGRHTAANLMLRASAMCTRLQRSRFTALLGTELEPPPPGHRRAAWRGVWYHLLAGYVIGIAGSALVLLCWLALFGVLATVALYPPGTPLFGMTFKVTTASWAATMGIALLVLLAAIGMARAVSALDLWTARRLLGRSPKDELVTRVKQLTESRVGVVDAADAERRRIERDLHDGAQQRLVALAMNLGMAREQLSELDRTPAPPAPEPQTGSDAEPTSSDAELLAQAAIQKPATAGLSQAELLAQAVIQKPATAGLSDAELLAQAREAIAQAHDEAKQALTELRQLVRGLHPAVLDHRGLDAALSGIAARSPVPARLRVQVADRPSPTVEAVAYFVVSEALTNVAKHARATRVDIDVWRHGPLLYLTIRDDGVGGADAISGTGLRGLSQRVGSVDGTLRVSSPAGGPTVITVELPCES